MVLAIAINDTINKGQNYKSGLATLKNMENKTFDSKIIRCVSELQTSESCFDVLTGISNIFRKMTCDDTSGKHQLDCMSHLTIQLLN